ncbi:putative arylsulfatase regulatory protein [Vibrio maritimus]|uniref:Putative arylsulfatase regulatory protein n=1 Tax=Vibrio maritimus TaxID=990268 RepID=A0A090SCQ4_9VIBR|nr:putative arylsulfatase regulatory protein [Vibrio maritimus]
MAKPIGAVCNIDCNYCYYLSKQDLLEYKKGCSPEMDEMMLEQYIKNYIEGQNTPEIIFSWQGGEPTMLGLDYFKKIVELQAKYQLPVSKSRMTSKPMARYLMRNGARFWQSITSW